MSNYLSVSLTGKVIPFSLKITAKLFIIFDDAVMDYCNVVTRDMRMSIAYLGRTMSRPSCMGNANRSSYIVLTSTLSKFMYA